MLSSMTECLMQTFGLRDGLIQFWEGSFCFCVAALMVGLTLHYDPVFVRRDANRAKVTPHSKFGSFDIFIDLHRWLSMPVVLRGSF